MGIGCPAACLIPHEEPKKENYKYVALVEDKTPSFDNLTEQQKHLLLKIATKNK